MLRNTLLLISALSFFVFSPLQATTPSAQNAEVYIISPKDGEVLKNPVVVRFGLKGMGVAPAGTDKKHTGHHHLLIDVVNLPEATKPVPSDQQHRHFGGGQTEVTLELSPGKHRLQLILGDKNHIPHNPPVISKPVNITVK